MSAKLLSIAQNATVRTSNDQNHLSSNFMATKRNSIEWIQTIDKEEYFGYFDGQKYFVIEMLGYIYRCKTLPVIPVGWNFVSWDKNLDKLMKRAQAEFECRGAGEIVIDIGGDSFQTKRRLSWRVFQN